MSEDEKSYLVNDRSHYKELPIEPFAVLKAILTPEQWRGFLIGNCVKYAMRAGHKGGPLGMADDLAKFRDYAAKMAQPNENKQSSKTPEISGPRSGSAGLRC